MPRSILAPRADTGSLDSVADSLREAATALRMTIRIKGCRYMDAGKWMPVHGRDDDYYGGGGYGQDDRQGG